MTAEEKSSAVFICADGILRFAQTAFADIRVLREIARKK
jgi:hypothetical protein